MTKVRAGECLIHVIASCPQCGQEAGEVVVRWEVEEWGRFRVTAHCPQCEISFPAQIERVEADYAHGHLFM